MSRHVALQALLGLAYAAAFGVLLPFPARSDISVQEAAEVVRSKAAVSVDGMMVSTRQNDEGDTFVTFSDRPVPQPGRRYDVNLTTGYFALWLAPPSSDATAAESGPEEGAAVNAVKAAARQALGPEADNLEWRVTASGSSAMLYGEMAPSGDPPRRGLTPRVSAAVGSDGSVYSYGQYVPTGEDREPLPVSVSGEKAAEIAMAADTGPKKDFIGARLEQRRGKVWWTVTLGDADVLLRGADPATMRVPGSWTEIDAQTGKIIELIPWLGGSVAKPAQPPSGPVTSDGRHPWAIRAAVAGVAALCVAAVVIVGLARRKPGAAA